MSTHRMIVPDGAVLGSAPLTTAVGTASHGGGNPFLDAMLEMPTTNARTSRSPLKMAASMLIHVAVIGLLIVVPVYFATNTVDLQKYTPTYVFAPPVRLAPPPPPAAARAPQTAVRTPQIARPAFVAPRAIPKVISQPPANSSNVAAPDLNAGVIGGVAGGVPGGVLGGIVGGTGPVGPPPPTAAQGIVRVGGNVRPPELVERVPPEYPAVARAAHVQGTVVIDAVIDTTGNVVSEHAISGPNLLIPAALSAVEQWKYQPTYLNGKPVELAMQVTVSFNLG
jgi:periplasmic protein TonB